MYNMIVTSLVNFNLKWVYIQKITVENLLNFIFNRCMIIASLNKRLADEILKLQCSDQTKTTTSKL